MKADPRLGLAVAIAPLVAVLAYAIQRLVDAMGEPPPATLLGQLFIPYYWRMGGSALFALGAFALLRFGSSEEGARTWLERLPWLAPPLVLLAVGAMILVP